MIILVTGLLGSGKTLLLSYFGLTEKKLNVCGNFTLKKKGYKKLTIYDFEGLQKSLILIDEGYALFDSRTSNSEQNRFFTNTIGMLSRKNKCTIIIGAQLQGSIDLRFRSIADIIINAQGYNHKAKGFVYIIDTRAFLRQFVLKLEIAEKIFPKFDTYEIPNDSTPTIFEPKRLNDYIDKVIEYLMQEYGENTLTLTKGMINDIMMKKGKAIPSKKMIETIYSRIKRLKFEKENEC